MGRTSDAKERLLAAALDLIWTSSYGSVSVDDICGRADVRKGSFYYFFPSKSALALAAYEAKWLESRPFFDALFSPQVPPLDRVEHWCQALYVGQKEKFEQFGHVVGCPYCNVGSELATQEPQIRAIADEMMSRMFRYLETAIAEAKREGLVSVSDPKVAAQEACSFVNGRLLQAKVQNDPELLAGLTSPVFRLLGAAPVVAN